MTAAVIEFPVLVFSDKSRAFACAYSASTPRELSSCPLRVYLRTGRLRRLRLVATSGECFEGEASGKWSIDWQFLKDVGVFAGILAAVLSGFNVVISVQFNWRRAPRTSLESIKGELLGYIERDPRQYIRERSKQAVIQRIRRAETFEVLCRAI